MTDNTFIKIESSKEGTEARPCHSLPESIKARRRERCRHLKYNKKSLNPLPLELQSSAVFKDFPNAKVQIFFQLARTFIKKSQDKVINTCL